MSFEEQQQQKTTVLETSHQDPSRSGVGQTALAVCLARYYEHNSENSIIDDPFAQFFIEGKEELIVSLLKEKGGNKYDPESLKYGIAVRTRKIDEELLKVIRKGVDQVVVVGAGLDCRAWRLGKCKYCLPGDEKLFQNVKWFELDFEEVLEYKKNTLKEFKPICQEYVPVQVDLSVPSWTDKFSQTSYNSNKPSVWLLEGFTSYLTEEELSLFMTRLSTICSQGSFLISTFVGNDPPLLNINNYVRFSTDTPEIFVKKYGWEGEAKTINLVGEEEFQRVSVIKRGNSIFVGRKE